EYNGRLLSFADADTRCLRLADRFFFSSRRRHTRFSRDWSSDVCSSDLGISADNRQCERPPGSGRLRLVPAQRKPVEPALRLRRRSEERRVGKECRSRRWADTDKKTEAEDSLPDRSAEDRLRSAALDAWC